MFGIKWVEVGFKINISTVVTSTRFNDDRVVVHWGKLNQKGEQNLAVLLTRWRPRHRFIDSTLGTLKQGEQ